MFSCSVRNPGARPSAWYTEVTSNPWSSRRFMTKSAPSFPGPRPP